MEYKDIKEEIRLEDIVLVKVRLQEREKLGLIIDITKSEDFVKVLIIESGIELNVRPRKVLYVKHTTRSEAKHYIELSNRLVANKKRRYENFEYIIDNIYADDIINDISAPYLVKLAKLDVEHNDKYVVNCVERISYLLDGIRIVSGYTDACLAKFCLQYCTCYSYKDIEDIMAIHYLI